MDGGDEASGAPGTLRSIRFAGHSWTVKTSKVPVGPGPNLYSADRVSVDAKGRLHLAIEHIGAGWSCAEIVAQGEFGYGSYRWRVASELNALDSAVLGLFLWSDEPAQAHRELDIEFSRWGEPAPPVFGSFTVQNAAPRAASYRFPAGTGPSEHTLTWSPGRIAFRSRFGPVLHEGLSEGPGVPFPGGGVAPRLNLWLFRGQAPAGPLAVTVDDFSYDPAPPRPTRE